MGSSQSSVATAVNSINNNNVSATPATNKRYQEFLNRGHQSLSPEEWLERRKRLLKDSKTLFHVTDEEAAKSILKSSTMLRGRGGLAGGGIYFATSKDSAERKAHAQGVLLVCKVFLGNVKTIDANGDPNISFSALLGQGHDSVLIPRPAGEEYVVYNSDQVEILEVKEIASGNVLFSGNTSGANSSSRRPYTALANTTSNQSSAHRNNGQIQKKTYQPFRDRAQTAKSPSWRDRQQRIEAAQKTTMYNITHLDAAKKIARFHNLLREYDGIAGTGIYLYASRESAVKEMSGPHFVVVTCRVKLGNVKEISPAGDRRITFSSMLNEGYDSVRLGANADLYVVYNGDQVEVKEVEDMHNKHMLYYADDDDDDDDARANLSE